MLHLLSRVKIRCATLELTRLFPVSILQNCRGGDSSPEMETEWVLLEESIVVQNEI